MYCPAIKAAFHKDFPCKKPFVAEFSKHQVKIGTWLFMQKYKGAVLDV